MAADREITQAEFDSLQGTDVVEHDIRATAEEKIAFGRKTYWDFEYPSYPNLHKADIRVTAPKSDAYNCIAYSVGYTDRPLPVWETREEFRAKYIELGYETCEEDDDDVLIDGWGKYPTDGNVRKMTHASRISDKVTTEGVRLWESKMGYDIRITHPRDAIGPTSDGEQHSRYGDKIIHFKLSSNRRGPGKVATTVTNESLSKDRPANETGSKTASGSPGTSVVTETLEKTLSDVEKGNEDVISTFNSKFESWRATWFKGYVAFSSRSADREKGPEWDALVSMGPVILPLVVNKLKKPENVFALQLYNKLQSDTKQKVGAKPNLLDEQVSETLQLYAANTIQPFVKEVSDWKAEQSKVPKSAKPSEYFNSNAYRALAAMGKNKIGLLVMGEYAKDQNGWWHELLYELENGKKSDATSFDTKALYTKWKVSYKDTVKSAAAA